MGWAQWWWTEWAGYYNLIPSTTIQEPEWQHPAWTLKSVWEESVDTKESILVVNKNTALVASDQLRSYSLDESLYGKEPRRGLGAADCAIFDRQRRDIMQTIKTLQGSEQIAVEEPFELWCWEITAVDTNVMKKPRFKPAQPFTGTYKKGSDIPGVAPRENKIPAPMGSFPVLNLESWSIEGGEVH